MNLTNNRKRKVDAKKEQINRIFQNQQISYISKRESGIAKEYAQKKYDYWRKMSKAAN